MHGRQGRLRAEIDDYDTVTGLSPELLQQGLVFTSTGERDRIDAVKARQLGYQFH